MLIGENRRFMSALITFKVDIDMTTGLPSQNLMPDSKKWIKAETGLDLKTSEEACAN